jgi:hypothetical protein
MAMGLRFSAEMPAALSDCSSFGFETPSPLTSRQTVLTHGAGVCPVGRVPAGEIEAAVINQLRAVFRQPEIVAGTWKTARAHSDDISEADARAALQQMDPLWDEMFPAEQARIVALLV